VIRDGADFKRARRELHLSLNETAGILRCSSHYLRDIEIGRKEISGPVAVAMEALLSGWLPADCR
jgi:cytoskeletal protein RodZ